MYRTLNSPLTTQVEITWACDNNCRWCYNFFRHDQIVKRSMTLGEAKIIADELIKNKILRCTITGGEPLLNPKILLYLVEELKKNNISVTINTNMNNFSKELGEKLLALGIRGLTVSLTGHNEELHDWITQNEGSFEKATNNIKLAVEMGFKVAINMVLTKWNIKHVTDVGNLAGLLGASLFAATRACLPGPIAEEFEKNIISVDELRESLKNLLELQKKWGYKVDVLEHYPWCAIQDIDKYSYFSRRICMAGITSASIGVDGDLRPCSHASAKYGNIYQEGLVNPWLRMEDWRERKYSGHCKECKYFELCTGGCPVDNKNSKRKMDLHVTCESDVIFKNKTQVSKTHILLNDSFYIPKKILLREEGFGGLMATASGNYVLFDKDTYNLLLLLREKDHFSINSLIEEFDLKQEELLFLFNVLLSKKLIQERR